MMREFPYVYRVGDPSPCDSPWGEAGRTVAFSLVSLFSKAVLNGLNTTTCTARLQRAGRSDGSPHAQGCDAFAQAVMGREAGRPLITVSNHASTFDDPGLLSVMLPWSFYTSEWRHQKVRWALCANDICHSRPFISAFFLAGKTLPIVRGAGREQPIMAVVEERLRRHGDWLHVFPEGRVRQDGQMNPLKTGLAQILCGVADAQPIVLPFHHRGMEDVMRIPSKRPATGKHVHVLVGEPVQLADLLQRCKQKGVDQKKLSALMMGRVAASLDALAQAQTALSEAGQS